MKCYCVIIFLHIFPLFAFPQTNLEFPDSNALWILGIIYEDNPNNPTYSVQSYQYGEDSMVNGISYHTLFCDYGYDIFYKGLLRKDSAERVFFIPVDSAKEFLLYDFSAQAGDTLTVWSSADICYGINEVVVTLTDTVVDGGIELYQVYLGYSKWIKGVGSSEGPIEPLYEPSLSDRTFLQCLTVNSIPVYPVVSPNCYNVGVTPINTSANSISIYPNPGGSMLYIDFSVPIQYSLIKVMNASGKTILVKNIDGLHESIDLESEPDGLYFIEFIGKENTYLQKIVKQH
jgi:hypothetical protein